MTSTDTCSEVYNTRIGLIELNEYYQASTDPNCKKAGQYDCNNYNYLYAFSNNTFVTINAHKDDTNTYFLIYQGQAMLEKAYKVNYLYPVVYISSENTYVSGTGTSSDPYIIR